MSASDKSAFLKGLSDQNQNQKKHRSNRFGDMLLPLGLLLGFAMVFGLLFGSRLLPRVLVKVAPVITLRREARSEPAALLENASQTVNIGLLKPNLLFSATGWVEPDPFAISVSSLVSGIVEEVYVLEGAQVAKGQKLAKLIDADATLDLEASLTRAETIQAEIESSLSRIPVLEARKLGQKGNIESEMGKLAELQDRFNRLKSLPQGSVPSVEVTAARLGIEQQEAKIKQASSTVLEIDAEIEMVRREIATRRSTLREAEVAVARTKLALSRHVITSPMDGMVSLLHVAPGRKRLIEMDDPKSALIVELFDPQKLQARIDVPLNEAGSLSVGQPVEMTTDVLIDLTLKGLVTRITGEADLQRNTLQVKVSIQNPDARLRPQMLVRGKFFALLRPEAEVMGGMGEMSGRLAIYVPVAAVFNSDQVWVVTPDDEAEIRQITLGAEKRENHQLATSGLKSGEDVILPPHDKLRPGAKIKIIP